MRAGPGPVLAGRYRLTGRPEALRAHAVDERTGATVLLHGLELPALVSDDLFADGPDPRDPVPALGERLVQRVAAVGAGAPVHPRLLQGVGAFVDGEVLWTVEEQPAGVPLADLLAEGPIPAYRAAELAADLAGALRELHGAGLVHGNVTARSVLVCEDGAALLGGLLPGTAEEALAQELGGPGGRRRYDVRASLVGPVAERWPLDGGPAGDCWALGVLLQRLVTGRSPYPEQDVPVLVTAVRDGRREPSTVCGPLAPLAERLLQPDPVLRPTAGAVRAELAALLAGAPEPGAADPAGRLPAVRPEAPVVPAPRGRRGGRSAERGSADAAPRAVRPPRIPPALLGPLLVAGVFVLLVLGVAGVVLFAG
ncbi:hypothetical protein ACWGB8_14465 [Kitasatospora sp. NPDC054939]